MPKTGGPDGAPGLPPTAPVEIGALVAEKYRIDRMIGFGGMGVVCEATHLELGTKVAIKFVRLEHADDERAVARFLTEARSAAQLKSQHTCRVIDCGRLDSGSPYMAMEYLEGADLRSIVQGQGPLPIEEAVSFALQACEALAEAHARDIVHRDIKPENLFLTQGPDGTALIKVLDFGISKQLGRLHTSRALTQPTESIGSPYHMSPEQMIDPAGVDARTDIWSLGVVLYELLTGRLPFSGDTVPQVCANVMTAHPPSPRELRPEVPEALAQVVLRCMDKQREGRFADVGALGRALKDFGGSTSVHAVARVERIIDRAIATRAGDDDDGAPQHIPGLPQRGRAVRVALVTIALAAGALAYYALGTHLERVEGGTAAPGEKASLAQSDAGPAPTVSAAQEPRPKMTSRKQKNTASRPGSPSPSSVRGDLHGTEPAWPASTSLYPDPKPIPDLPLSEEVR